MWAGLRSGLLRVQVQVQGWGWPGPLLLPRGSSLTLPLTPAVSPGWNLEFDPRGASLGRRGWREGHRCPSKLWLRGKRSPAGSPSSRPALSASDAAAGTQGRWALHPESGETPSSTPAAPKLMPVCTRRAATPGTGGSAGEGRGEGRRAPLPGGGWAWPRRTGRCSRSPRPSRGPRTSTYPASGSWVSISPYLSTDSVNLSAAQPTGVVDSRGPRR